MIYVAVFDEAVYVLHAFHKKSKAGKATPREELDLAARRYRELMKGVIVAIRADEIRATMRAAHRKTQAARLPDFILTHDLVKLAAKAGTLSLPLTTNTP